MRQGRITIGIERWLFISSLSGVTCVAAGGLYVSFIWYRANLTIPAKIGNFETVGGEAVLTAYVDDYAEVWINDQMPRRSGC